MSTNVGTMGEHQNIERRTLIKGAAWAAPVVAVAAAAPMAAASGTFAFTDVYSGSGLSGTLIGAALEFSTFFGGDVTEGMFTVTADGISYPIELFWAWPTTEGFEWAVTFETATEVASKTAVILTATIPGYGSNSIPVVFA